MTANLDNIPQAPSRSPATSVRCLDGQLSLPFSLAAGPGATGPRSSSGPALVRSPDELALEATLRQRIVEQRSAEQRAANQQVANPPAGVRALSLHLTDNRYTMVMVRRTPTEYVVRLHKMFAQAKPRLLRALARYVVASDSHASTVIGAFIEKNRHQIESSPQRKRRIVLRTAGEVHDLQPIFDQLNRTYFGGTLAARITWGSAPRRLGSRRSIKMGSFAVEDRLIRIHPLLDDREVPDYFVAWVVFHEMLHGKFEVVRKGERRCFHSKEFLAEEQTFADHQRAAAWQKANIDRLLGPTTSAAAV